MTLSWGDCCRHNEEAAKHSHFVRVEGGGGLWECEDCQELAALRKLEELDKVLRAELARRRGRCG